MSSWAHEEVMTADLGDRRLDDRLAMGTAAKTASPRWPNPELPFDAAHGRQRRVIAASQ